MDNNLIPQQDTILYHITQDQVQKIVEHFDKDINSLEEYEITELLDRVIDEL